MNCVHELFGSRPLALRGAYAGLFRPRVLSLAVVLAASSALAQDASFEGLGVLDRNAQPAGSSAMGMSSDGSKIVGSSFFFDQDLMATETRGFIWTASGGMITLPLPPNGLEADGATAISDDGSMATGHNGFFNGFFYEVRNGMFWTDAMGGNVAGTVFGDALSMNDLTPDGALIVGATRRPGPFVEIDSAFYYTTGEGIVPLGYLPGGTYSWGEAVSADGSVIVGYGDDADSVRAFRWTSGTGLQFLDGQEQGVYSSAYGVSPDGSIVVGGYGFPDESAFRWTQAGQFEILGKLDGARKAYALDLSADGSVVVGYSWFDPEDEAFIWTQASGMRSVAEVLTNDYHLDLTGWTLQRATGVSDDGTVLCGYGTNPDGSVEAWVAHLPANGGGLRLSVDSPCPSGGTAHVNWTGATPGGRVAIVLARNQGNVIIPTGPCAGTSLGLGAGGLRLVSTVRSDRDGAGTQAGQMPGVVCGSYLQLVDASTCATSNVARIE